MGPFGISRLLALISGWAAFFFAVVAGAGVAFLGRKPSISQLWGSLRDLVALPALAIDDNLWFPYFWNHATSQDCQAWFKKNGHLSYLESGCSLSGDVTFIFASFFCRCLRIRLPFLFAVLFLCALARVTSRTVATVGKFGSVVFQACGWTSLKTQSNFCVLKPKNVGWCRCLCAYFIF